jgi:simple sugar transport system permease protein
MSVHHRYVDGVAGSYGFDGIAVALLGGLTGGGAILSALFFGLLANGSDAMQSLIAVPAPVSVVVQAVVILSVGVRALGLPARRRVAGPAAGSPGDSVAGGGREAAADAGS